MHALIVAALALAPGPAESLAKVQAAYRGVGDLSAKFQQTFVEKVRGKKRVESGSLWVKKDGRVRWSYRQPAVKDFVFDGTTAYFYEPDNAQVTVFERYQDSPVASAMRFLWGQGELAKTFAVEACDARCAKVKDDALSLVLVPKEPLAGVERIQLDVDPDAFSVRRSVVFDPLGNRTEYVFTELVLDATVADAKFEFKVPPGVSLQRASLADDAGAKPKAAKP